MNVRGRERERDCVCDCVCDRESCLYGNLHVSTHVSKHLASQRLGVVGSSASFYDTQQRTPQHSNHSTTLSHTPTRQKKKREKSKDLQVAGACRAKFRHFSTKVRYFRPEKTCKWRNNKRLRERLHACTWHAAPQASAFVLLY